MPPGSRTADFKNKRIHKPVAAAVRPISIVTALCVDKICNPLILYTKFSLNTISEIITFPRPVLLPELMKSAYGFIFIVLFSLWYSSRIPPHALLTYRCVYRGVPSCHCRQRASPKWRRYGFHPSDQAPFPFTVPLNFCHNAPI